MLDGTDGEAEVTRDALGETIKRETVKGPATGEDIRLTIDAELQARPRTCSPRWARPTSPAGATAIVMNPRSSQVLALANWPDVELTDLDERRARGPDQHGDGFTYEPGSTFKAFTVAAALEEGLVTPETMFDLPPTIQVADRKIEESHERGPVTLSVADILAQSSNVGAVKIGLEVGGRPTSTTGSAGSASASRPGSSSPARSRDRARGRGLLGLDAWATCRSARASR